MKTLIDVLRLSAQFLADKGIERPRREAEELLCHVLTIARLELYMQHDRPLDEDELAMLRGLLARRVKKEPLQYIIGNVEFLGCQLDVDRRALIPRPETELLADHAAKALKDKQGTLIDLCCGSGCIAIALKKACPQLDVIAIDVSPDALELASSNAKKNQVEIEFLQGDLFDPLQNRKVDYCVSNPPYIARSEMSSLSSDVFDYEPHLALLGGDDGLDFYRKISQLLPGYLQAQGRAWLEIGASQGESALDLFKSPPWKERALGRDLAGRDRYIFLVKE